MVNNQQAAANRDALAENIAEGRQRMLAACKAIPGNKVVVKMFKGGRWRQVAHRAYPDVQGVCYITFELLESRRRTTYHESDVQERVLDALAMHPGPFPEFFPHSLGDPDFEPEMGFVTYDGYEPTPSMLP